MKCSRRLGLLLATGLSLVAAGHAFAQAPLSPPPFVMPPPPKPERPVMPPPPAPPLAVPSGGNAAANVIPNVEVWHNSSRMPQKPLLRGRHFETAYLIGTQKATIRLRFPPRTAGSTVVIKAGPGVTFDPPQSEFQIGPGGQCVISLALDRDFAQSDIEVYHLGTRTRLSLTRATAEIVAAEESRTGGRP